MRDVLTEAGESRRASPRKRTKQRSREHLGLPRARGDEGGALMEFALILPFLAMLVFGTIDLARAFTLKNRVTNMAREGAFYGQSNPGRVSFCTSGFDIRQVALAEDPGITTPGIVVTIYDSAGAYVTTVTGCPGTAATPGYQIRVTVSKRMPLITPLASQLIGSSGTINVAGYEQVDELTQPL